MRPTNMINIPSKVTPRPAKGPFGERLNLMGASALGLGLSPIAPGTCGALLGVFLHVVTVLLIAPSLQYWVLAAIFVSVCLMHFLLTPWAQAHWSEQDPAHFVLDEVAGYLVVPLLVSADSLWQLVIWGFISFRVFDIIKIPPARQIDERMHGALGIILDDLVSGIYAALFLYLIAAAAAQVGFGGWLRVTFWI